MATENTQYSLLILNWWDISNPEAGGAEVHLNELFGRIASHGHQVTLLCCGYQGSASRETINGIQIIRRGSEHTIIFHAVAYYVKHQDQFDIVVDYTNKIPFMTPLFVRPRRLAVAHHINGEAFLREFHPLLARVLMAIERFILWFYRKDPFIAVSESTRQELIEYGVDPAGIWVVHNGADHVPSQARSQRQNPVPLVAYIGRLKRYKSIDILIEAMAIAQRRIPDLQLVIMGSGDCIHELRRLVSKKGLGNTVTFYGRASDTARNEQLSRAWVLVNPSIKEGWGLGVMEAARCGTPAIGADVPGLRDTIMNEETGLLLEYGNVEALAEAIVKLLEDKEYRDDLGQNAKRWSDRFSWDDSASELLGIIREMMEGALGDRIKHGTP